MIPPMFPPHMAIAIAGHRQVYDPAPGGAPTTDFLLLEDGSYLLQEDGSSKIILE